jgi:hypothetical protein
MGVIDSVLESLRRFVTIQNGPECGEIDRVCLNYAASYCLTVLCRQIDVVQWWLRSNKHEKITNIIVEKFQAAAIPESSLYDIRDLVGVIVSFSKLIMGSEYVTPVLNICYSLKKIALIPDEEDGFGSQPQKNQSCSNNSFAENQRLSYQLQPLIRQIMQDSGSSVVSTTVIETYPNHTNLRHCAKQVVKSLLENALELAKQKLLLKDKVIFELLKINAVQECRILMRDNFDRLTEEHRITSEHLRECQKTKI